jgi:hypothetical protein
VALWARVHSFVGKHGEHPDDGTTRARFSCDFDPY